MDLRSDGLGILKRDTLKSDEKEKWMPKTKREKDSDFNIAGRQFKKSQLIIGITGIALLILLIIYFYIASEYKHIFLKGTSVNGVNISEMNSHQAANALAKSASKYKIEIHFREDGEEEITANDIDFHYEPDKALNSILNDQNRFAWLPAKLGLNHSDKKIKAKFDEGKLKKKAKSFKELKKKNMKKPVNAYPEYEDKEFHIVPEYEGTKIKKNAFIASLGEYIQAEQKDMTVEDEDGIYKEPKIREDNETLNEQIKFLNDTVATSLTYDLWNGEKKVLDGNVLINWLDCEDGVYSKNEEKWEANLNAFVEELWLEVGTLHKPHKFTNHNGEVITVPGVGYYGYSLDKEKELDKLHKKDLKPGKEKEREPYYLQREAASPDENYGFGGNYVEVNLSEQMAYVYEDGEVAFSTDVVSGLPSGGRMTPDGCYVAHDKQRGKVLTGPGYRSPTNYWIRLTGNGVGLHDAPWRGSFGGSIWRSNGSHGCINLPYYAAATIYDMVPEGEPVIVYYED